MSSVAETDAFRSEIREIIRQNTTHEWKGIGALSQADDVEFRAAWRQAMVEARLLSLTWPTEVGGRGLGIAEQAVMIEELVAAGLPLLPGRNDALGFNLLAPTLLHWGTESQKDRFLPGTLTGAVRWAQGYSEPDAGSDLFGLRTVGSVSDAGLVINGQKVWQTAGLTANWIFTLVRTDPTQARGRGISFVLIDIDQPGVEVRGIRDLTGEAEFCEVFFTDAYAPIENVIGGLGNGGKVALSLLGYERAGGGITGAAMLSVELNRLIELAKSNGSWNHESIRERIARCWVEIHTLRAISLVALESAVSGTPPGPESSIIKNMQYEQRQTTTELAMEILGFEVLAPSGPSGREFPQPQPGGTDPLGSRIWTDDYLVSRAGTLFGGSSEIQRNTIAEQILGMPRDPRPAKPEGQVQL